MFFIPDTEIMRHHTFYLFTAAIFSFIHAFSQVPDITNPKVENTIHGPLSDYHVWNPGILPMQSLLRSGDSMHRLVALSAFGEIRSNALNLNFSVAALQNQFIDEAKKQSVSKKLDATNAFEYNTGGEFAYRFLAERFLWKRPAMISLSVGFGSVQQTKFTGDVFNVVFFGNAGYAGRTADFSGTKAMHYDFRQIKWAVQKKFERPLVQWETGLGLSLISAKNGYHLDLQRALLFTEENGEYLDATYRFVFEAADTSNHGFFQTDGGGFAADLMLSCTFAGGRSQFAAFIQNAGLIAWNKRSLHYNADSLLHFEGIEVQNFLQGTDTTFFQFNRDTLLNETGTHVSKATFTTALPASFTIVYVHAFTERWRAMAGISYRPFPDLVPLVFVKQDYAFNPWFSGGCSLAYGGTAGFQIGFLADAMLSRHFNIRIVSENIIGLFLPKETSSTSVFLQAAYKF